MFRRLISCAVPLLATTGCLFNAHGRPPDNTSPFVGAPPAKVRIIEWKRPDMFYGEFAPYKDWQREHYILGHKDPRGRDIGAGWYVWHWTTRHTPEPLTADEERMRRAMEIAFPPGTEVRVDYPLLQEKWKIGDPDAQVRRGAVTISASTHGGTVVRILERDQAD